MLTVDPELSQLGFALWQAKSDAPRAGGVFAGSLVVQVHL
jgi:hypothetical protein